MKKRGEDDKNIYAKGDNFEYNITTLDGKLINGRINSLAYTEGDEKITMLTLTKIIKM